MNTAGSPIPGLLVSIAVFVVLAAGHALIAWPLARRFGPGVLAFSAVAASLAVFGILQARVAWQMRASGLAFESDMAVRGWPYIVPPFLIAFGLSSLSIRRSLRQTDAPRPSFGPIARSVGAFFVGYAIATLGALVIDFARIGS